LEQRFPLGVCSEIILDSALDHIDGVVDWLVFVGRWIVIAFKLSETLLNLRSEGSDSLETTCFVSKTRLRLVSLFKRL
jgi:hypothetical protein